MYKSREEIQREHEAFKNRLVADVLGAEGTSGERSVPMDKVVMLIWQFRDDPTVVTFMARFVAKFAGSRTVFDGIEFYLPQLAHMIIHLEAEWDDAILERFALVIAQQSLHFALQFNWILQGTLEDYQPELPSGLPNPSYNPLYYARCIKLLTNLERCVVYGRPRSQQLQRLYEQGKITKQELHIMENADRRFHALQLTSGSVRDDSGGTGSSRPMMPVSPSMADVNKGGDNSTFASFLMYKRPVRLGAFRSKGWKKRYFVIEEQMLNCYRSQEDGVHHRNLVRAMPLDGASITDDEVSGKDKYPHMFTVSNREYEFKLRAKNKQEKVVWMRRLTEENDCSSLFHHTNMPFQQLNHMKQTSKSAKNLGTADQVEEKQQKIQNKVVGDLTPSQLARYEFFRNERRFVRRLTDIAEELRFLEKDERKRVAPGLMRDLHTPKCVYLPLCNSSDTWRRVCKSIPEYTKVFSTKARCPTIMFFLSRFGEDPPRASTRPALSVQKKTSLDVAEYMHMHFEVVAESTNGESPVVQSNLSQISEAGEEMTESQHEKTQNRALEPLEPDDSPDKGSRVWHNTEEEEEDDERNRRSANADRPLRSSFAQIPKRLADRMDNRRKGKQTNSVMDNIVDIQTVPILEGQSRDDGDDASISSSVMYKTTIVLGDQDLGDIDQESLDRAKQMVSGGESWAEKSARMLMEEVEKAGPEEANKPGSQEVISLMSKSNDDLRQEVFVMQMIHFYKSVFASAKLPLWLKTYRILSTSKDAGVLEVIMDATSLDGLKKHPNYPKKGGLRAYFEHTYGAPNTKSFKAAQKNFMQSLAAYSIVSYLLGLKDRHNGNIMIDTRGHLVFIDFGFAMGMNVAHEFTFERSPFKLTPEYVEVMGGPRSKCFQEFKKLFVAGFKEARKNAQLALGLVEIMMYKSNFPCFSGWRYGNGVALTKFQKRLMVWTPDRLVEREALRLVNSARGHLGTYLYDCFQKATNGYAI
eukprot:Sro78_g042320.1 Phosphatidylinositol 4-kinase beta (981) ;mRNA; r:25167-28488